jgi:hypothetical protein
MTIPERLRPKTAKLLFFLVSLMVLIPSIYGDPFPTLLSPPRDPAAYPGNGFVHLSWSEPEIGALTVMEYNIFRGEIPGEEFLIATLDGDTLSYRDAQVQNGVRYHYYITAKSDIYTSDPSDPVSARPDGTLPLLEILSPSNNSVSATGSFEVRWAGEDRESGLSHYRVRLGREVWKDVGLETVHLFKDLEEGEYLVQISAVDNAGNEVKRSIVVFVDSSPPRVRILEPGDGDVISKEDIYIAWQGDDYGTGIDRFRIMINDYYSGYEGLNENYTIEGLKEGYYTIVVEAFDRGDNVGWASINISVDTSPPWLLINSPVNNTWTNISEVQVLWTSGDSGSGIKEFMIQVDGGPWISKGLETSHTLELTGEGEHPIGIKTVDKAGRETTKELVALLDVTVPNVSILEPIPQSHINRSDLTIRWRGEDPISGIDSYMMKLDDGSFTRLNQHTENTYRSLSNGPHVAILRARDRAGNYQDTEIPFNIDTIAPEVSAKGPVGSDNTEPWLVWVEFKEEMASDSVRIELSNRTGSTDFRAGRYVFEPDIPLDYGLVYSVSVIGRDLAGNPLGETMWTFRVTDQGMITGRIFDDRGYPIQGARVVLDSGKTTSTDQEGNFLITDGMGKRTVTIIVDGFITKDLFINITPNRPARAGNIYLEKEKEARSSRSVPAFLLDAWTYLVALLVLVVLALVSYLFKDRFRHLANRSKSQEDEEFEVRIGR